jgi:hypothetical protein
MPEISRRAGAPEKRLAGQPESRERVNHSALWQLGDTSIKSLQQDTGLVSSFD